MCSWLVSRLRRLLWYLYHVYLIVVNYKSKILYLGYCLLICQDMAVFHHCHWPDNYCLLAQHWRGWFVLGAGRALGLGTRTDLSEAQQQSPLAPTVAPLVRQNTVTICYRCASDKSVLVPRPRALPTPKTNHGTIGHLLLERFQTARLEELGWHFKATSTPLGSNFDV